MYDGQGSAYMKVVVFITLKNNLLNVTLHQEEQTSQMKFYRLSGTTFYDCMNTISQSIQPFLDNKMSIFEEY